MYAWGHDIFVVVAWSRLLAAISFCTAAFAQCLPDNKILVVLKVSQKCGLGKGEKSYLNLSV